MNENLVVAKDVAVGLAYTLYVDGAVEDSAPASDPLEYLHGHNNLISGLEKALEGMKVGDKKNVTVEPEEAYGEYDPENVIWFPQTQKKFFKGGDFHDTFTPDTVSYYRDRFCMCFIFIKGREEGLDPEAADRECR